MPSQCGKRIWTSSSKESSRVSSATRCDLDFARFSAAVHNNPHSSRSASSGQWQCRSLHTTGRSLGCSAKHATSVSTLDACTSGSSSPASRIVPTASHPGRRSTGTTNGVQRLYKSCWYVSHEYSTELSLFLSSHSQIRCIDANKERCSELWFIYCMVSCISMLHCHVPPQLALQLRYCAIIWRRHVWLCAFHRHTLHGKPIPTISTHAIICSFKQRRKKWVTFFLLANQHPDEYAKPNCHHRQ